MAVDKSGFLVPSSTPVIKPGMKPEDQPKKPRRPIAIGDTLDLDKEVPRPTGGETTGAVYW